MRVGKKVKEKGEAASAKVRTKTEGSYGGKQIELPSN